MGQVPTVFRQQLHHLCQVRLSKHHVTVIVQGLQEMRRKKENVYVSEDNRHIHIHTGKTKHTHRCTHKCPPSTHTHMYMFTLRHSITEKLFGGYGVAFLTHGESAPHLKQ